MFRPRVIPTLLLDKGKLVKTIGFEDGNYIGDPMNAIKIFNDLEADELAVIDINASKTGATIDTELIRRITNEAFMPVAVGGNIKSIETIQDLLGAGCEKVILTTGAYENKDLLTKAAEQFGSQSTVAGIDARKNADTWTCYTHSGKKTTGKTPEDLAKEYEDAGAGEILITSVDKEGSMEGYDIELVKTVTQAVSIPVIANGGAGEYEDIPEVIEKGGASAAAAGSVFVYRNKNRGVLVYYPDSEELMELFEQ